MYVPKAPIVSIMRFTQSIITAFRGGSLPDDSDDDDDKHGCDDQYIMMLDEQTECLHYRSPSP